MWIVLPLKASGPVKSRLVQVLSPEQRQGLMMAIVRDVLAAAAACPGVDGTLLVSRDTGVLKLADEYGAEVLSLEQDENLNSAVTAATDYLYNKGAARALVLHGDIPLIRPSSLSQLICHGTAHDLALVACRHGRGTKALVTRLPSRIPFLFGEDSFSRHRLAAEQCDLDVKVLNDSDVALDVNSAEDLSALCRRYRNNDKWNQSHTCRYITKLGLLHDTAEILQEALSGAAPDANRARALALATDLPALVSTAAAWSAIRGRCSYP
jgi:2-phospho-L-lactate guanylyltransferase